MSTHLAVILKGYPRLSETFVAQELLGLQELGLDFEIWSLRSPTDTAEHPAHRAISAPRKYLPEYLHREPLRVLRAVMVQAVRRRFWQAAWIWLRDLMRARDLNQVRRFGQAAVLASELPPKIGFLYAHFLHTPASVTRYAAIMRGLKWGVSAHAKDIWTTADWEKREKLTDAAFCVTCTGLGAEHLNSLAPQGRDIELVYHGLDLSDLPEPPYRSEPRDTLTIVSVGRLVEKKGYGILLDALASLPDGLRWKFVHVGGGELSETLEKHAEHLGITEAIEWRGAQPRETVFEVMRAGDVFVLPSRVTDSGDRDGLPNVLMEAASQKLPVISTRVSSIPEFIQDGVSGTLVPPDDAAALRDAIAEVAASDQGAAMAEALYDRLRKDFGARTGIEAIHTRIVAQMPAS